MIRKNASLSVTAVFLIQMIFLVSVSAESNFLLSPPTRIDSNNPNRAFMCRNEIMGAALFVYKLDAFKRQSSKEIAEKYDSALNSFSRVTVDLAHIDFGKKGFTRYYPVSAAGECFLVRIFLTEERFYQPDVRVLEEISFEKLGVTVQILPGINELLKSSPIEPIVTRLDLETGRSV